eukprot:TRINITY_DN1436_c0_g1_i2.p1 TRINITY_DN1436_c0_g1~~TRINITY_DN1436_c0_g1_i2.p1  ORF type:complete len:800 (+),score=213.58 TRINITY_DN1436_c0_g1_i2:75-2474(+)
MAGNATRESILRNALVSARDVAKRSADHKEIIKKFIRSFESDSSDDIKFGKKKYKAMLQQAANGKLGTIFIDLNDVEAFCNREILEPDAQLSQSPIQLQQSIESLLQDVEQRVYHYQRFFYEACDLEQPPRDAGYHAEGAALARDAVQSWRERMWEQQQQTAPVAGGSMAGLPPRLKNTWDLKFKPRNANKSATLREMKAESVGTLVQLDCLVVRVSQVKPKVEVVTYHCEVCGSEVFQSVEGERYTPPKECPSQRCRDNKQSGKLRCNIRTCAFTRYQEMKVQEMSEHVPVGGVPRSINVILQGDLTRQVLPGDAITLTGVYTPHQLPYHVTRQMGTTQEMYIEAHNIQKHKKGYNETQEDEDIMDHQIKEARMKDSLYETASKSIAPEIFGHGDVKKALLLVLIGSFTKQQKDGLKIRGDIHALMMGDPGVAKSQLLKQVCAIAPRSVYTTGKGSSGVGLTASVVRDNQTGEVTLEGGALVLADMGVCCIDEFDKMEESDRTAIHEVMEQQTVSIAKSGITTTLNCRTTVLAAANPVYGRYNPYKSPVENMDLPAALLSRFDLIFLLLDTVEGDKDKQLALHVAKVHSNHEKQLRQADEGQQLGQADDGDVLGLGFKPFDHKFMRAYIQKARSYEPLLDDALMKDIADAYVSMRDDEKREGIEAKKSYTTPRTLLGIMRLSQAHARARFSNKVERQDFDEAMRLLKASKESIELSAPAKRGQNPLDLVYEIVADLSRREQVQEAGGWVDMAHVVSMAGHKALTRDMVLEAIENWESLSVLNFNPEKTMVKFLVPPMA